MLQVLSSRREALNDRLHDVESKMLPGLVPSTSKSIVNRSIAQNAKQRTRNPSKE